MGSEYNTLQLISDLSNRLGGLSQASKLLGYGKTYLSDLKQRITNPNVRGYNPNYLFSLNNLNIFKKCIESKLGDKGNYCLFLINKYIESNENLKQYSNEQFDSNLNFNYFYRINTLEKAYWLGFLFADGSIKMKNRQKPWYRISLELSVKDRLHLQKFCKALSLNPTEVIKERTRYKKYKDEIRKYPMVYVYFRCKPMVKDLLNLGFSGSKSERKYLPIPFQKVDVNINKTQYIRRLFLVAWLL